MKERETYQQKMRQQFDEWNIELGKLRVRAISASVEVRDEMHEHIESLENRLKDGRDRLHRLNETTDEAWGSVRDGVETAWASLKTGFHEAAERFRKM